MARLATLFAATSLLVLSSAAGAQDFLNKIVRSSVDSKTTFAVYDVRPGTTNIGQISEAVADAFRKHYDGIQVMQQMAPHPLPSYAPRMGFQQVQHQVGVISEPLCPQASAIIASSDTSMAKYGEVSILQGCVFPYRDGYRVNVYALFVMKSGGLDPVALGSIIGRSFTKAIGFSGDTSKFIGETVDDVETRLKALGADVALVELQPARPDREPVADRAPAAPEHAQAVAAAAPSPSQNAALPPQLRAAQAQIAAAMAQAQQANAALRQPQGAQGQAVAASGGDASAALQARKDLSAMGLTYFDQAQFIDAARRGDRLACELFLRAGSVTVTGADKKGATALKVAPPELAAYLRTWLQ